MKKQLKQLMIKKKNKGYLTIILFIIGITLGFGIGYLYNELQRGVVSVDVYACYYGDREPWDDIASQMLYNIISTREIQRFNLTCYEEKVGCPPNYNEKYDYSVITSYVSVRDKLNNFSYSVYPDTAMLGAAFSELCRYGFSCRNTSPYLDGSNYTFLANP